MWLPQNNTLDCNRIEFTVGLWHRKHCFMLGSWRGEPRSSDLPTHLYCYGRLAVFVAKDYPERTAFELVKQVPARNIRL